MFLEPLDPHVNLDPDAGFLLPVQEQRTELWLAARGLDVSLGEWEIWRGRFLRAAQAVALDDDDVTYLAHAVDTWPERFVDEEGRLMGLEEWLEREARRVGE